MTGAAEKNSGAHARVGGPPMSNAPKKSTGEIGPTRVTATPDGTKAELISTVLPDTKEALEKFFAERFLDAFNASRPLGPSVEITGLAQNDTNDLDFRIACTKAEYLELAELNPRSEEFGRAAYRTGKLNVYSYAKWIYNRVIRKKERHYGDDLSRQVMLLLYTTHWQFLPSQNVFACLKSYCLQNHCKFAAVFILLTDGTDLRVLELVWPYVGSPLPLPGQYKGITVTNLPPGHHTWKVDTAEVPPEVD